MPVLLTLWNVDKHRVPRVWQKPDEGHGEDERVPCRAMHLTLSPSIYMADCERTGLGCTMRGMG